LFERVLSNDDLVYLSSVLKGKLLENETLMQQAVNNTGEQFGNSPDLSRVVTGALNAHQPMSS